jgi:hypothetical protein
MASTIPSFDGSVIEGSITNTGSDVFAAFDWERLVLPPLGTAIIGKSKISANVRLRGFPPEDHDRLTEKLGHYSDVQSLNGEDTVTWSVFGCASREGWLNDMLAEVFGPAERPTAWELALWSRICHPDTGKVGHGPQSDVVIQNAEIKNTLWRYVVEAKWTGDISVHKHGQDQLQMRTYEARLDDVPLERSGVIVVVPCAARYSHATKKRSIFSRYFTPEGNGYTELDAAKELNARALTWERLVEIIAGRGRPKLEAYMGWRLSQIR